MCYFCGSAIDRDQGVFRSSVCTSCHRDLHACLNCRFYSPGAHWDCAETVSEPVNDKTKSNFCDSFAVNPKYYSKSEGQRTEIDKEKEARKRFSGLFGDDA